MELVFIPWFELKEYFRPFTSEAKKKELIDSLTDYEKWLIKEFNLSYEQLNLETLGYNKQSGWRYRKVPTRISCNNSRSVYIIIRTCNTKRFNRYASAKYKKA